MDLLLRNNKEVGYQKITHQGLVDINLLKLRKYNRKDKKRKRMFLVFILFKLLQIILIIKNNSTIKKYNHQGLVNIKL
jgi:hypothetical protein